MRNCCNSKVSIERRTNKSNIDLLKGLLQEGYKLIASMQVNRVIAFQTCCWWQIEMEKYFTK